MMKKQFLCFCFLLLMVGTAKADDLTSALVEKYPLGGHAATSNTANVPADWIVTSFGSVKFFPAFASNGYTQPTVAEIDALVIAYTSLANTKLRQIAIVTGQANSLLSGSSLDFGTAKWTTHQTALNATISKATTEINALLDVASVKSYHPTWPAKP